LFGFEIRQDLILLKDLDEVTIFERTDVTDITEEENEPVLFQTSAERM